MVPQLLLAVTLSLFVTVNTDCGGGHWKGMLWNTFQHSNTYGYTEGVVEPNFNARRNYLLGTTQHEFFVGYGTNEKTLQIFDTGVVCIGTCPPADGFLASDAIYDTEKPFITVLRTIATNALSMTFEMKFLLRDDELNDGGIPVGSNICYFETVDYRLKPYAGAVMVTELVIVTWKQLNNDDSEELFYQLVLAYTSDNGSYAMMYIDPDVNWSSFTSRIAGHVNGYYVDAASPKYATVCGTRQEMLTKSNNFCGQPGEVVFDLSNPCTQTPYCANLDPNPLNRDDNCRDLVIPHSGACYVTGYCQRTSGDEFTFDFRFSKEFSTFGDFEVINGTEQLGDPICTLNAIDEGTSYRVVQVVNQAYVDTCGVNELGDGWYGFTVHNYGGSNLLFRPGTKLLNITCHPDQLLSDVTEEISAGDIVQNTVTLSGGDSLTMSFGNMANPSDSEYLDFTDGAKVLVGRSIYTFITYRIVPQFIVNIDPYGIYVQYCELSNSPYFNDSVMTLIENRCPKPGVIEFSTGFISIDMAGSSEYRLVGGPFPAARWRNNKFVWLKCVVDFCITTDYEESFCEDSCFGKGVNTDDSVNQARKRRQSSDNSIVLTAHLRIVDNASEDDQRALSCANKTLAYTAIATLLLLLFVATAITALLFLKLRERKLK